MAASVGARDDPAAPITVTVDGVTVLMLPVGWADFVAVPDELERILAIPLKTPEEEADFVASLGAFAERIDAYAAPGSPCPPSRVPARAMREFVRRWVAGVRDAAVPPPSGGASRSPRRTA